MIPDAEFAEMKKLASLTVKQLVAEVEELRAALTASVELQSHYAGLLNDYDGGKRMQFKTAADWLKRLAALGEK